VNKTELIEHIAKTTDTSKASAARSLEAMIDAVRKTLKKGGTVSLVGFGTFAVAKVPKFRPGKGLKDAINGR
jgi:DNA-binding protein HU-beta